MQTRHPGIADEIQGAINTLRKIQKIAGPGSGGAPAGGDDDADGSAADGTQVIGREVPRLEAGSSFGRYQIARLLGQGAMGSVYLAYDSQLHRYVALKTPFLGDNRQTLERFYREARAAAALRSPHLCPIYDVGQIGGITYLSMAFIDGHPLGRLMAQGQLGGAQAVTEITIKIARGVQKAHEQGIIHRDLKPDNVMIDTDGEPIVMDFGLARQVNDDIQLTTPGRIIGTPAYMSPEQVEGDPARIGPATDIYSLGVVLYQMLTGRLPFQGSMTSVLRQIGADAPPRPSSLVPGLGVDSPLEQVCLKMMAKSPADRYGSMAEVIEALEGTAARDSGPAAKPSAWSRVWSRARGVFGGRAPRGDPPARPAEKGPAAPAPPVSSRPEPVTGGALDKTEAGSEDLVVPVPAPPAGGPKSQAPPSGGDAGRAGPAPDQTLATSGEHLPPPGPKTVEQTCATVDLSRPSDG
jgi:predicted Ser/Thr protein kinase